MFILGLFTRFGPGSCLVPAGRGGIVSLKDIISDCVFISSPKKSLYYHTEGQFVNHYGHKLELIFHEKYCFYILDMLDYLHESLTIDEYMANKTNDHIKIKQHHELFQDKSKCQGFFKTHEFTKDTWVWWLTLHSKPESLSLFDDDDFFSSLRFEDDEELLLPLGVLSTDAIRKHYRMRCKIFFKYLKNLAK